MKSNKGFSLVELIVVIAIMAIIAAVAVPVYSNYVTKANEASDRQKLDDAVYAAQLANVEFGTNTTIATQSTSSPYVYTFTFAGNNNAAAAAAQVAGILGDTAVYSAQGTSFTISCQNLSAYDVATVSAEGVKG